MLNCSINHEINNKQILKSKQMLQNVCSYIILLQKIKKQTKETKQQWIVFGLVGNLCTELITIIVKKAVASRQFKMDVGRESETKALESIVGKLN